MEGKSKMYEEMKIIKDAFKDNRKVKPLDNTFHLFQAEDGTIIYMDMQMEDFTTDELLRYVEKAELLYHDYQTKIQVYLICPLNVNVLVKEFAIKSEADFTIKLAKTHQDMHMMILDIIKKKVEDNTPLNSEDMKALELLPMVCPVNEQHTVRKEVFKIMNMI